jgi:hypothetical protein
MGRTNSIVAGDPDDVTGVHGVERDQGDSVLAIDMSECMGHRIAQMEHGAEEALVDCRWAESVVKSLKRFGVRWTDPTIRHLGPVRQYEVTHNIWIA